MKTRVVTLKRDNKEICLVGAQHIASSNYFNKIQKILDFFKPSDVFYEMIKSEDENHKKNNITFFYEKLSEITNLKFQKDEIKYNDLWNNSDVSLELYETFLGGEVNETDLTTEKLNEFNELLDEINEKKINFVLLFIIKHLNLIKFFKSKDKLILDLRNYKVLLDVFEHLRTSDNACIFYGDNHLDGMIDFLKRYDFKIIKTEKLNPLK